MIYSYIIYASCSFQKTANQLKDRNVIYSIKLIVQAFKVNLGIRHFALYVLRCYHSMQILKAKLKIFEQSLLSIILEMNSFTSKSSKKMLTAANFGRTRHQRLQFAKPHIYVYLKTTFQYPDITEAYSEPSQTSKMG